MRQEIRFYIPRDHFTYTFEVEDDGQFIYMDQSLRYHDFTEYVQNTVQSNLIAKGEFYEDLNKYLRKLIVSVREVTTEFIQDVCIEMCKDHISEIGRLWFNDLLYYADLYINIDRAIYHRNTAQYKLLYKDTLNKIISKFPSKVLFPNPFFGKGGLTLDQVKNEFDEMESTI